jgi:dienelactone hydrolase
LRLRRSLTDEGTLTYRSLLAAAILGVVISSRSAYADFDVDGVPLPSDATVSDSRDPAAGNDDRFRGAWVGAWDGELKHILIVESVDAGGEASVVKAWGDNANANIHKGWQRLSGKISGDTLSVSNGFTAEYKLISSTMLSASWRLGALRSSADMFKVDLSAVRRPEPLIVWGTQESTFVPTPFVEDGKPVRIEVVLYRPPGSGPFPLLVVNHGSTGMGDRPELFRETWSAAVFAQYFVAQGWLVAFPQRRGRGKSDGLYDEGFLPDRSRYACDREISLGGAQRALDDIEAAVAELEQRSDVLPGPILMAGQSRGGALAVAYAGRHPNQVKGVINFVGGWIGSGCPDAAEVNSDLLRQGGGFHRPTLWFYGDEDPFYPLSHSRKNFSAFLESGGSGKFVEVMGVPDHNGHRVIYWPKLWETDVREYLKAIK